MSKTYKDVKTRLEDIRRELKNKRSVKAKLSKLLKVEDKQIKKELREYKLHS